MIFSSAMLLATAQHGFAPVPELPCDRVEQPILIRPAGGHPHPDLPQSRPPGGDPLGDAWEMVEISCWRGIWLRRGKSDVFDGYWMHPNGERQRATLRITVRGRHVSILRRHKGDRYCRYRGWLSEDWRTVSGDYDCDWARSPMRWFGQVVRMDESQPAVLRN